METRAISQLTPNKHSFQLYGEFSLANEEDYSLFTSISVNGILEPLIINGKNEIVSGVRRYFVAKMLNHIKEVPVTVIDLNNDVECDCN